MPLPHSDYPHDLVRLAESADHAAKAIPPLFPLASSVAVNPFLGQADEPLVITAARFNRLAGVSVTPPRSVHAKKFATGVINTEDLDSAKRTLVDNLEQPSRQQLIDALSEAPESATPLPTVADLAAEVSGIAWPEIVADRVGHWAASHFDLGQALWQPNRSEGAYIAWRSFATRDISPEIHGLKGFSKFVNETSRSHWRTLYRACNTLGITQAASESVFLKLLLSLGGWSQFGRFFSWQAELNNASDDTTTELLAIRLVWEEALLEQYRDQIESKWRAVLTAHMQPLVPSKQEIIDTILLTAAEHAEQRKLLDRLHPSELNGDHERRDLQAAFCIDVRSEIFRRALESLDAKIETIGFAGFFGIATAHQAAGSEVLEERGPALLPCQLKTTAVEASSDDLARRCAARAKRAWGRFKLAAVSSFAFVEATGPVYFGKLLRDTLAFNSKDKLPDPAPRFDSDLDLVERVDLVHTVLQAMSLTDNFARIVMLVGHGASVTNNPHESGLHCGACGGYAGDVNARLLASLLNDKVIQDHIGKRGINIPGDTLFIAALHNTTTDEVTFFDEDILPNRETDLKQIRRWLNGAAKLARSERAMRLPTVKATNDIERRARDWSEIRPEWGLAGCRTFIAAPRQRTLEKNLNGQAFLHSYDWRNDPDFKILELIMTAPVVVASWISLQYFGSTVTPSLFGGGNKLLHNVIGGIGVLEGNGGNLRSGLPWQSVHDGEDYQHDPLRLTVAIEAPENAMTAILQRHPGVKNLFDNNWLHLLAINERGVPSMRYARNLQWDAIPL
ncbi:MAG: DUF2309 domain-containing protein [Aestuariivita sp.]|nr:DUF2309 domain-containing protein [Aestuariivita sp.]MCY4347653.1 DUF2309 domain-containing protein [Aestuariivita sp.]